MALHLSGKLCVVGLVVAALITAFSQPKHDLSVVVDPSVQVLESPRELPASLALPHGPVATPTLTVRATGYNSHVSQTDSTPDITATGVRTRFGIIAVSRDLLGDELPYGSLVRIVDLGNYYSGRGVGQFQELLDSQQLFIVEDTMHPRKRNQIDVWFPQYATAVTWGVREVEVEVVRYGRDGPELFAERSDFVGTPKHALN